MEDELRKLFHDIANKQNNVANKAGIKSRMTEVKNIDSMSKEELLKELKAVMEELSSIERTAVEAGQALIKLKDVVYTSLGIKKMLD